MARLAVGLRELMDITAYSGEQDIVRALLSAYLSEIRTSIPSEHRIR